MDEFYSSTDPERFISNPLTAFRLVRQLRNAGIAIEDVARRNISEDFSALRSKAEFLPSDTDLDGVVIALLRLQDLYKLDPKNMTGLAKALNLNPDECFHIAMVANQKNQFQHAALWMQETLRKLDEVPDAVVTKQEVLQRLASVPFPARNLPIALGLSQVLPPHVVMDVKTLLQLAHSSRLVESIKDWDEAQLSISSFDNAPQAHSWHSDYEALCRGEGIKMTPQRQRKMVCRYTTGGGNPRLIYAPAKQEQEWDQPLILRFHDFLTISEIKVIKELSRSKLARAKVVDPVTGEKVSTTVRVSKSAWLSEDESPVVARVNQRIGDVTGLDMETAEDLQIANYGIGGQYEPHYDSALVNDSYVELQGRRIATVLVYMSDVEVGGSTVFPSVGAALRPKMGSAVVWFNLLKSGEEDARTLHAACPVFLGSKWVANKWIRSLGQEFRRKCSLSSTE
ncbi:prolyl 4-hydroxylase subunit alpha-1 [Brachyhypopomus gauderio]|uniref:prolyl 4-hydroxylase subunit alpha-1 n=1 Tax=Brachyhypopomus gauderio TaxID=698409 RepID=UPI00404379CF